MSGLLSRTFKRIWWETVELWDDLHYSGRRWHAVRRWLCRLGLHWPIRYGEIRPYYGPPEDGWSCDFCSHERLPYRAWLWRLQEKWHG